MALPPRLPGTRPRASARTACVPYTATLWREHRVQDREHYPVLRSGSLVFAGPANGAARGAAAMSPGCAGWGARGPRAALAARANGAARGAPAMSPGCAGWPERTLRPLWPDQPWGRLSGAWSRWPGPDARWTMRAGTETKSRHLIPWDVNATAP